jgi:hypothetical protein
MHAPCSDEMSSSNQARHTHHRLRPLLKHTFLPLLHPKTVHDAPRDADLAVLRRVEPRLRPDTHLQPPVHDVEELVVRRVPVRGHVELFRFRAGADVRAGEVGACSEECLGGRWDSVVVWDTFDFDLGWKRGDAYHVRVLVDLDGGWEGIVVAGHDNPWIDTMM